MLVFFVISKNPMDGEMFKHLFMDKTTMAYGGQAFCIQDVPDLIGKEEPQIIFLEVEPHTADTCIDTIKSIKEINPLSWFVCFSFTDQLHLIRSVLENGACGYLCSPVDRLQAERIVQKIEKERLNIEMDIKVKSKQGNVDFFESLKNTDIHDIEHFNKLLPKVLMDTNLSFDAQLINYQKTGTDLYYFIESKNNHVKDIFVILYNQYMLNLTRAHHLDHLKVALYNFIEDYKHSRKEKKDNFSKNRIIQAKKIISELIEKGEAVTLNQIADLLFISPSYLSRTFKKEEKTNFINYVNCKRIEKAKILLSTTSLTIDTIAYECGYKEPNSFRRFFKQNEAMTPSAYREKISEL